MWWPFKRKKGGKDFKVMTWTTNGKIFDRNEKSSLPDPVRNHVMWFMRGYLEGKTSEQIIGECEEYFRRNPSALPEFIELERIGFWKYEEDYRLELHRIYRKLCDEGKL